MSDLFEQMAAASAHRVIALRDEACGLHAIVALDSLVLGPACGGIRTQPYASTADALADAQKLAAAMTLKCAIAGLAAGGGKTVVIDHLGLDRATAFRRLGQFVQDLRGLYRCAGDLGTTNEDLLNVAKTTEYCEATGEQLGTATGATIVSGIRACAAQRGIADLARLSIAIQGCGLIGSGVARAMAALGARVILADADPARAAALAAQVGGQVMAAGDILAAEVDVVSPCAIGGVLTQSSVERIRAWAVCGGANNQLQSPAIADRLAARDIHYVPDFLASSGAVIDGVSRTVMHCDPTPLLAAVEDTARTILHRAGREARSTVSIAEEIARDRISAGERGDGDCEFGS